MSFKEEVRRAFYSQRLRDILDWIETRRYIKITASDNAFTERYSK